MSIIQLGTITQLWQNVSDWATGVSATKPKIQIDQTILGVTNGVSIVGSLPNDALTPATGDIAQTEHLFNGLTWDRARNNTQGTLLPALSRTVNTPSAIMDNFNARGVIVTLYVYAASGTGGLQIYFKGIDPASGYAYQLNATIPAITTIGLYAFELYPGANASPVGSTSQLVNQRIAASLPRNWQIVVGHLDASAYQYSVGYSMTL